MDEKNDLTDESLEAFFEGPDNHPVRAMSLIAREIAKLNAEDLAALTELCKMFEAGDHTAALECPLVDCIAPAITIIWQAGYEVAAQKYKAGCE